MRAVKEYLASISPKIQLLKKLLENKSLAASSNVHLTIGNVSCDMDSFVCSIALSWMKSQLASDDNSTLYLPMVCVEEEDFQLRTDITHISHQLKLPVMDSLIFLDSFNMKDMAEKLHGKLSVSLVDHHVLDGKLSFLEDRIVEIIDHRPQVKTYPNHIPMRNVTVGSCSTLVAEHINDQLPSEVELPLDLRHMLLCAILLDTGNLNKDLGKTTQQDISMVKKLATGSCTELNKIHDEYSNARFNVSSLTTVQLMKKDAKFLDYVEGAMMMSSIHLQSEEFLNRKQSCDNIRDFCSSKNYSVWVGILPVVEENGVYTQKPILLHSLNLTLLNQLSSHLEKNESLTISKIECGNVSSDDFILLRMNNVTASRKQVLPVVTEFLKS